eukprot:TRINITY_DN18204_c0_g1_i1.p1 TRINITY_DN18204_c0_g1~~TRINITY_DN18204_c0_g1_i1.p1  ORF type:complete len:634 (+),score=116.70 TRINITY_DN18204_c0_g1_i1:48-1949(+)
MSPHRASVGAPQGDGGSGASLSLPPGDEFGPEGMLGLVRSQMRSILQPFAENVEELHKSIYRVAESLQENIAKADEHANLLSEHRAQLSELQIGATEGSDMQSRHSAQMESLGIRLTSLEQQFENSQQLPRITVEKLDNFISVTTKNMDEMRKGLDDTRGRVLKCQDGVMERQIDIVRANSNIDRLNASLKACEDEREKMVQAMDRARSNLDNHIHEVNQLKEEQGVQQVKYERFCEDATSRLQDLDDKSTEALKQAEIIFKESSTANAAAQSVSMRLDACNSIVDQNKARLSEMRLALADQKTLLTDHFENVNKLMKMSDAKHAKDMHEMQRSIDVASADISKYGRMSHDVYLVIYGNNRNPDAKNNILLLQEDARFANRRAQRIEAIMGLEPMSKDDDSSDFGLTFKNGILLSEAQIAEFKETFGRYDADGGGSISTQEVGDVMKSLGHDVPDEAVQYVIRTIDADKSGEIDFDEFCTLMGKMLGPDGQVDVDAYMKLISEDAVREAKQNQMVEIVPALREEVHQHEKAINNERNRLDGATKRLEVLEGNHADLLKEVRILRKGLDLNQEYWKGLSQGLKDTSKSVHQEGEGQMLPSPTRLRQALPSLGSRPVSARNSVANSTPSTRTGWT